VIGSKRKRVSIRYIFPPFPTHQTVRHAEVRILPPQPASAVSNYAIICGVMSRRVFAEMIVGDGVSPLRDNLGPIVPVPEKG
jgi:hypothetical protein